MGSQLAMELNLILLVTSGIIMFSFHSLIYLLPEYLIMLSMKTPPGTKIQLTNSIKLCNGILLLEPKNFRVLGGQVPELVEEWKIQQVGK